MCICSVRKSEKCILLALTITISVVTKNFDGLQDRCRLDQVLYDRDLVRNLVLFSAQ